MRNIIYLSISLCFGNLFNKTIHIFSFFVGTLPCAHVKTSYLITIQILLFFADFLAKFLIC